MSARNVSGAHIVVAGSHDYYGDYLARCAQAGHPVGLVKVMFDGGAAQLAKEKSGETYTIFRCSIDDNDFPVENWDWSSDATCRASAEQWMAACDKEWSKHRSYVDAFELTNEPNMATTDQVLWFEQWTQYCMEIAESKGYRLAIGGFSTGCPPESHMRMLLEFLDKVARNGHVLAVHDGAVEEPFTFKAAYGDGTQLGSALRYRFWHRWAKEEGYGFPNVAITECYAYGKWGSSTFYPDWQWYLGEMAKDSYVKGVAWYTLGDGGIFGNIAGKPLQKYTDAVLAIDWDSITPDPESEPGQSEPMPADPTPNSIRLKVPFANQNNSATAGKTSTDCGPACLAMVEAYAFGVERMVNAWYEATGAAAGALISINQLQTAAQKFGYTLTVLRDQSLDALRDKLSTGIAPILLVNATYLRHTPYTGPHFVVATGYEKGSDVFYIHDPNVTNSGLYGGPYTEQLYLSDAWGKCHEQSNPDFVMMILEKKAATSVALNGVGMANPQALTSVELDALRTSKVKAFKLLTTGDPDTDEQNLAVVNSTQANALIMARLFFKPDYENKTWFPAQTFVNTVMPSALRLYAKNVRLFEIHNEPNLCWEGWGWQWANGYEFATWFNAAVSLLKAEMPDAKFGFPGLSPQADDQAGVLEASLKFLQEAAAAVGVVDWLGVHCYWQSDGTSHWQMRSEDYGGMYWKRVAAMYPLKTLMITEYSCNNPNVADADKGAMYKTYPTLMDESVKSTLCFALSWPGQDNNREGWVRDGRMTDIPVVLGN